MKKEEYGVPIAGKTLFAFWVYNDGVLGETFLGGEVSRILDNGDVQIPSYGEATFTPALIVPYTIGIGMLQNLEDMRVQLCREHRQLKDRFQTLSRSLIGLAPKR